MEERLYKLIRLGDGETYLIPIDMVKDFYSSFYDEEAYDSFYKNFGKYLIIGDIIDLNKFL